MLDVIIVGGGPAGLSAALVLGRCRRRVLVCDAGHPRNEASRAMHGFLSRDGMPPAEFLKVCREQLRRYDGVTLKKIRVVDVERGKNHFTALLENGAKVVGRTLLLATGIVDDCPKLEGFSQFYGKSVHHCPYCDGWEHRDQPIAVYGSSRKAVELAVEVRHWSKDVILCTDGPPKFKRKATMAQLRELKIPINERKVLRLEGRGDKLEAIRFVDGTALQRDALFFSPGQRQHAPFGEKLGCKFDQCGAIECATDTATSIPGLFVAGNASTGLQLVIMAAAEGTQAAFTINQALLDADTPGTAGNVKRRKGK